jgi:hypothetical protein|tara:strand:+ start:4073 stop:4174 length:102 start_codon:yes stop_codon:yes gene_type:complete
VDKYDKYRLKEELAKKPKKTKKEAPKKASKLAE